MLGDAHFWTTTRGRVLALLRRSRRTVEDLAAELGVTDNAVRLHLDELARGGLVRASGVKRDGGVGKPATIYEIDPAGEAELSRAYVPLLTTLLAVLGERLDDAELRATLRDVGKRLANGHVAREASGAERVAAASRLLNALGGVTSVERVRPGVLAIQGCGCPVGTAVAERPEVCLAIRAMLSQVIGAPVREKCAHGERPQCRFEVTLTKS